ncbi:MAG: CopD family protein [Cyanobacteria bacterium HKST-UBA06]|nr:CopD family protein [Cyanobacteria bacterium HKST-UBA04]MCA9806351.1 CopD family protein [Cyanobacteria bacterium HKST-UBA06]
MPLLWIKALHLITALAWVLGDLYGPKLLVYFTQPDTTPDQRAMLTTQLKRLVLFVATPGLVIALLSGVTLIINTPGLMGSGGWLHVKLMFALILMGFHGYLLLESKTMAEQPDVIINRNPRYYKLLSKVPELCMVVIIVMAIVKPF